MVYAARVSLTSWRNKLAPISPKIVKWSLCLDFCENGSALKLTTLQVKVEPHLRKMLSEVVFKE